MALFKVDTQQLSAADDVEGIVQKLNGTRGMYMSSGVDYPGRYSRWDMGFIDPPIELIGYPGKVIVNALSLRGELFLAVLMPMLTNDDHIEVASHTPQQLVLHITPSTAVFSEEERSKQPSVVLPLRCVMNALKDYIDDPMFGFYGAYGYELIFEFDPIQLAFERGDDTKLFHVFMPDRVYAIDRQRESNFVKTLVVEHDGQVSSDINNTPLVPLEDASDHPWQVGEIDTRLSDKEYEEMVLSAKERMRVGDIFEVVFSRGYEADFSGPVSTVYENMKAANPSPYEFLCQLGDEQLVATSPEMFVRVKDQRIESCPISGTIRRGDNAIEDEARIRELLNSTKDEVELTMCTDVDRNDKSRLCEPGSIRLISRRSIEGYSSLFHTVDHVEGVLRPEFDGLDGFLSHMWAVTLTGAPKHNAVQIIENTEQTSRHWYGGAVGRLSFNGDVVTAITIRCIHFKADKAHYRVGATLVWDSEPQAEVTETKTKSVPFHGGLGLLKATSQTEYEPQLIAKGKRAVMIDNQDSFVMTLAEYFRRFGMEVLTYRAGIDIEDIMALKPDLVIHSPGPGTPSQFKVPDLVQKLVGRGVPQFGVCLGLQGMIEAFGGELTYIDNPHHGKKWQLTHDEKGLFEGIEQGVAVAGYHSIIADKRYLPECLEITATNERGHVMAVQHKTEPCMAVQFHPESILTLEHSAGLRMISNVITCLVLGDK